MPKLLKRERPEQYAAFEALLSSLELFETFNLMVVNIDSLVAPVPEAFADTKEVKAYFAECESQLRRYVDAVLGAERGTRRKESFMFFIDLFAYAASNAPTDHFVFFVLNALWLCSSSLAGGRLTARAEVSSEDGRARKFERLQKLTQTWQNAKELYAARGVRGIEYKRMTSEERRKYDTFEVAESVSMFMAATADTVHSAESAVDLGENPSGVQAIRDFLRRRVTLHGETRLFDITQSDRAASKMFISALMELSRDDSDLPRLETFVVILKKYADSALAQAKAAREILSRGVAASVDREVIEHLIAQDTESASENSRTWDRILGIIQDEKGKQ